MLLTSIVGFIVGYFVAKLCEGFRKKWIGYVVAFVMIIPLSLVAFELLRPFAETTAQRQYELIRQIDATVSYEKMLSEKQIQWKGDIIATGIMGVIMRILIKRKKDKKAKTTG